MLARSSRLQLATHFGVYLAVAACLFLRSPTTNFVFDEQEALLANPFVQGGVPWSDIFRVDFWGRGPTTTIGSYRPLPNVFWRALSFTLAARTPFYLHLLNVVLHAVCATLLSRVVLSATRDARAAFVSGLGFAGLAVATEVVAGVVGLADILVVIAACATLLLVRARTRFEPLVVVTVFLGFLSKETMVAFLPLGVLFAWFFPRKKERSRLLATLLVALSEALGAFGYVLLRRTSFFVETPLGPSSVADWPLVGARLAALRAWFRQPDFPIDPLNNPLVDVGVLDRVPTVFAVTLRSLRQVVVPFGLSGDYSFAEEVKRGWDALALGGAFVVFVVVVAGIVLLRRTDARLRVAGFGLVWLVVTYVPVSNALVLLPTIRADRLWYMPALGFCIAAGASFSWLRERAATSVSARHFTARTRWRASSLVLLGFTALWCLQVVAARAHAFDYQDDLVFWTRTVEAAPRSAKARLNLGVMVGARGQMNERIRWTRSALDLAPDWPMGNVYLGDALCREKRVQEAFPFYEKGLADAPNQTGLVALALQCLWDQGAVPEHRGALEELAREHPSTWLSYLVGELDKGQGVPVEHRPRGYNQSNTTR